MLTCSVENGIYEGSITVMSKEIDGKDVTEVVQMGITLVKVDILTNEIKAVRIQTLDVAQMYKIIEMKECGNIMRNGEVWRGRTIRTIKTVLVEVLQASNLIETYDMHKKVFENFIQLNAKNENQEHVGIGWAEVNDKQVKIHVKLTKRDCNHIKQRIEIYQTKTKILQGCKENENIGRPKSIYL